MGIVFFCQSCGARFDVDARMAGKKGRCKKCGQFTSIPRAEEVASMVAMPVLAGSGVAAGAGADLPSMSSWLKGSISGVGLAPLTVDRMPIGVRRGSAPSPLDDAEDSKPYALAEPVRVESRGEGAGRANVVMMHWRRQLGRVQRLFRKLNEFGYLVSVPFLMILLLGTTVRNRPLALFGATVVVLLNIGRIVAGVANLAVIPFRDGIDLDRMKKPFRRVVEPVATIGLVVLAFTFIPWLSRGDAAQGSIGGRLRSGAAGLREEMKGEVEMAVEKVEGIDIDKLGGRAREALEGIGPSPAGGPAPPSESATGGPIKGVREAIEGPRKRP